MYREIVCNPIKTRNNPIIDTTEDLKEYSYTGTTWSAEESADLLKEYNQDKLHLLEICKLRKRLPKEVIFKIRSMNMEQYQRNIRGYYEYRQSDLYKQVRKEKRDDFALRKVETNVVNVSIQKKSGNNLELEVSELKDEIESLKNEMISIKATLYDIQQSLKISTKRGNLVNTHLR